MSSAVVIDTLLRRYDSGDYFSSLVNQPVPHRLRRPPELVYHATLGAEEPRFTIVMPTFNHAAIVVDSLTAAVAAATLPFDCVVVDDGSEDGTAERARAFFSSGRPLRVARATIVRNPVPIYETACDNLGFTLAETEIIVEVQADIQIREPAFDATFLRAAATTPRPSALSGRCGHTFRHLAPRNRLHALFSRASHDVIGLCGKSIETPALIEPIRGHAYRCETVNRGPWLVFKSDLERHGYLDERHFFQGNDDHDYHRRIFEAEERRPLYVATRLHAPLALGAYRRPRTGVNRVVFQELTAEKRGSPDFHRFMNALPAPFLPERIG